MPSDLQSALERVGVQSISTVAANWRYVSPEDTLDATGERKELVDFRDTYQLTLFEGFEACAAIDELRLSSSILVAECDRVFEPFGFPTDPPNDPDYPNQWHLNNTGQVELGLPCDPYIDINAPEAWQLSHLAGSPIAIVDDGITRYAPPPSTNQDNPDVTPFVAPYPISKSFATADPADWGGGSHGTNVAGLAAARGNNSGLVAGVANSHGADPQPMLVSLRVICRSCLPPTGWTAGRVSSAMGHLAAYPTIRVSNHSYGHDQSWRNCWDDTVLRDAFRNAYFSNNCLIAATGNGVGCTGNGCNPFGPDSCFAFPAAYDDFCLGVTAVGCRGTKVDTNQFVGSYVDIAAPGGESNTIWSTGTTGGTVHEFCCTSAAAPMVAGTASLMLGVNPGLSNDDIYGVLRHTTASLSNYGLGPIDVGAGLHKTDLAIKFLQWPYQVVTATITGIASTTTTDLGEDVLQLRNIPGTGAAIDAWAEYRVRKYRVTWSGQAKNPIVVPVIWQFAWNRGRSTRGAPDIGPAMAKRYDHAANAGHADVLSLTSSGALSVETYSYKVMDKNTGQFLCWYPFKPNVTDPDLCAESGSFVISYGAVYKVPLGQSGDSGPSDPIVRVASAPAFTSDSKLTVRLELDQDSKVTAILHDVTGRVISKPANRVDLIAGPQELAWPIGATIGSRGIYFLTIEIEGIHGSYSRTTRRMVVSHR